MNTTVYIFVMVNVIVINKKASVSILLSYDFSHICCDQVWYLTVLTDYVVLI